MSLIFSLRPSDIQPKLEDESDSDEEDDFIDDDDEDTRKPKGKKPPAKKTPAKKPAKSPKKAVKKEEPADDNDEEKPKAKKPKCVSFDLGEGTGCSYTASLRSLLLVQLGQRIPGASPFRKVNLIVLPA
jgi:hypothetical protein